MATSQKLHPECVIDIIRHGHAAQAPVDFDRVLSEKGCAQAAALGKSLGLYDIVLTSSAPRAKDTAARALNVMHGAWYPGTGRQLYGPANDTDFAEILRLTEVVGEGSCGDYLDADTMGVFQHYMAESREHVLGLPGIEKAERIAIFAHAVLGNALAEAFFPEHAAALWSMSLAPCDMIRISASSCEHIPLPPIEG